MTHRTSAGAAIASFGYTHDKIGNRLTKTEIDVKYSYGYDAIYRLLQAMPTKLHGRDKEQEHKAESFSYDPVGNRLSGPKPRMTYTYGPDNALLTAINATYAYDKNGNLTAQVASGKRDADVDEGEHSKNRSYTYDHENRLIKAETRHEDETIVVSFKYDPFGRRIEKKVEEIEHGRAEEAKTYTYVYDNEDIILEYKTSAEDGQVKTVITKYVHGPGIDEPLSIQRKGEIYYYHADGLGSIVALTDNRQKVVESYSYDSFGNLKRHGDKVKNTFTYTGREWDKETGLYYYRARYYDPMEGRFISKDPIGLRGGINYYRYVQNNPVNYTDPTGLFGAGGPGSTYPGHADFSGNFPDSESFSYNLEDTDPFTSPYTDPERHFRDLPQSEADVASAISSCNKDAFQRAMHRGQDYFSHYSKGYRWKPFRGWNNLGFGHLFDGTAPDEDIDAWNEAAYWTEQQLNKWRNKCGCMEQ